MTLLLDTDARNVMANAIADEFDSVAGTLTIYESSGTPPASANDAANGTALAVITLPAPAFGASSSGVVSLSGTWQDLSADATGTADYFRIVTNGGAVIQGTVTATGGGGDLTLSSTSLQAGGAVSITSFTLTMPSGE